ncbi:MAG: oxidoreductase, partial [Saccharopolyspora rectivirgula]
MAVTATRTAATISELREQAWGRVLTEQDEGYDEARKVQNAMFDRHPKVIVRCATAGDVIAAVNHARDNG